MRRMAIALTAATLLVSAGLSAQAPALSGHWTLVPDPNAAPPAGGGGGGGKGGGRGGGAQGFCGMECTIAQDAKTLTVTRTTQAGEQKAVYNLDGSDSKNMVPGRQGGAPTEVVSKAKVEGSKIVISTTRDFNGTVGHDEAVARTRRRQPDGREHGRHGPGAADVEGDLQEGLTRETSKFELRTSNSTNRATAGISRGRLCLFSATSTPATTPRSISPSPDPSSPVRAPRVARARIADFGSADAAASPRACRRRAGRRG